MSKEIVISLSVNYGDEFDIYNFDVVSEEYFEETKKIANELPKNSFYVGFGTNEEIEFMSPKGVMDSIKVLDIKATEDIKLLAGKISPNVLERVLEYIYEAHNEIIRQRKVKLSIELYNQVPDMLKIRNDLAKEYQNNLDKLNKHRADKLYHKHWYKYYEEAKNCEVCKEIKEETRILAEKIETTDKAMNIESGVLYYSQVIEDRYYGRKK